MAPLSLWVPVICVHLLYSTYAVDIGPREEPLLFLGLY